MLYFTKRIVFLSLFVVLFACTAHDEKIESVIANAQMLIDVTPDSSLTILDEIREEKSAWPMAQQMKFELVYAQAQNKAFVNFTTDSIVLEVADYYGSHGSANEIMLANYMVGCAYRDLGDAPSALKYMNIAVDAVGRDDETCDLETLMAIHSQLGGLYQNVAAFESELLEDIKAEQIAWQIGDTLSALRLKWNRACCLYDSHQVSQALAIIDSIDGFVKRNGLREDPMLIYPIKIDAQIKCQNSLETGRLLHEYEKKVNITPESSCDEVIDAAYFQNKGHYYSMIDEADSAIQMYQCVQTCVRKSSFLDAERYRLLEASYRGMVNAYSSKHQPDSVVKYAKLYCELCDSVTSSQSSEQMFRMQALYNYTKIQEQVFVAERNVSGLRFMILLVVVASAFVSLVMYMVYQKHLRKVKRDQIKMNREYQYLLSDLDRTADELHCCRVKSQEREAEIQKLQSSLDMYQANAVSLEQWRDERNIVGCEIAKHLHTLSVQGLTATEDELERLSVIAESGFPVFFATISNKAYGLSKFEINICVLIRFNFISSEIAVLTSRSSQRITNIKSSINKKIFGKSGAKALGANLLALK